MTSACATKSGTGAGVGAVGGGIVGGALGGTTGALIGAAAGGLFGYGVGKSMEEQDRRRVVYALETNEPSHWRNPETGMAYDVRPTETYVEDGRQCRRFRIASDAQPDQVYGTACRQSDGDWVLIDSDRG